MAQQSTSAQCFHKIGRNARPYKAIMWNNFIWESIHVTPPTRNNMIPLAIFFLIFLSEQVLCSHIPPPPGPLPQMKPVKVHKCCGPSEIMVDRRCVALKNATIELWSPIFTNEIGEYYHVTWGQCHPSPICTNKYDVNRIN